MNNKAPRDEILESAADWCDRLETLTPSERRQLNAWIAADPEHARAYDRMRRTMQDVALLEAEADLPPEEASKTEFQPGIWLSRVFAPKASWGVLVGAAAAICAALYFQFSMPVGQTPVAPTEQILATATGQRSSTTLADQSVVYLNADTRIAVTYSDHTRLLNLSKGEAIFQVSKDKARPFRVVTDRATVTAVGTRFGVDRVGDAVEVRVYEGTVKVEAKGTDPRAVTHGQWLLLDPKRGVSSGSFAPDAYSNWRSGWLEADRMPLSYVVTRLNRYTDDKIVLDNKLAGVELNGRFRLDNTAASLKMIAAVFDVDVQQQGHRILLTPKHK